MIDLHPSHAYIALRYQHLERLPGIDFAIDGPVMAALLAYLHVCFVQEAQLCKQVLAVLS